MDFQELYSQDRFANEMGIKLESLSDDLAQMSFMVTAQHLNAGNAAHGGAIFTLADITMAAIANYKQMVSVSIQSDMRFISAALEGDKLTARAEYIYGRKSSSHCRVSITNQDGKKVCKAKIQIGVRD